MGPALCRPGEDGPCSGGSRQAVGQTRDGRYPRAVYVPDAEGDGLFAVTAYPLAGRQAAQSLPEAAKETRTMMKQRFPKGWDEQRVKRLIEELDARTDEEWIAADEASVDDGGDQVVIAVPATLLPEVRRLIATHNSA
jgi:hypothetical protein